jgi:hypothetical protein
VTTEQAEMKVLIHRPKLSPYPLTSARFCRWSGRLRLSGNALHENTHRLHLIRLSLCLLLFHLQQQRAVDVWQDTTERDSSADERIEFFVTSDGKLKMARCDTFDLEILGGVACELEHFGSQVFENGGQVDAGFGADARLLAREVPEVTLYATAGELN